MESEILKVRRVTLEADEIAQAIEKFIEENHKPPIVIGPNDDVTIKHNLTPGGRYLSARIEIAQGKGMKERPRELEPTDEEPTEAEMEEHVQESSKVGEPIHPDEMIKNLVSGKK